MKKLVRSRAGRSSPRPSISIRVRPIEMSKWPASSNTVQCGRFGSTGTSRVDADQSGSVRPRKVASIRASSSASVSIVVSYEPMLTFYHQGGGVRQGFAAPTSGTDESVPGPRSYLHGGTDEQGIHRHPGAERGQRGLDVPGLAGVGAVLRDQGTGQGARDHRWSPVPELVHGPG